MLRSEALYRAKSPQEFWFLLWQLTEQTRRAENRSQRFSAGKSEPKSGLSSVGGLDPFGERYVATVEQDSKVNLCEIQMLFKRFLPIYFPFLQSFAAPLKAAPPMKELERRNPFTNPFITEDPFSEREQKTPSWVERIMPAAAYTRDSLRHEISNMLAKQLGDNIVDLIISYESLDITCISIKDYVARDLMDLRRGQTVRRELIWVPPPYELQFDAAEARTCLTGSSGFYQHHDGADIARFLKSLERRRYYPGMFAPSPATGGNHGHHFCFCQCYRRRPEPPEYQAVDIPMSVVLLAEEMLQIKEEIACLQQKMERRVRHTRTKFRRRRRYRII